MEGRLTELPPRRSFFQLFSWYWVPVLVYVTIIFSLSAQPNLRPPLQFPNSDKFFHMLEYGGLGYLLARGVRAGARIRLALTAALIVAVLGGAIAASDEIFQGYIPGRDSSLQDWFADFTGLLLAQIVYVSTHD